MSKIGVDTNVFIYTLDKSSFCHRQCDNLLKDFELELYTTTKNLSEYFAVCTKIGIDRNEMNGFYNDIKNNVNILFPTEETLQVFEELNEKYKPRGNRVFDIEIVSIFLSNNISTLATINTEDFKNISEIMLLDIEKNYNFRI